MLSAWPSWRLLLQLQAFTTLASVIFASTQAAKMTSIIPDFPNRLQWLKYHGYCGETCIQSAAMTHGVWVSQQKARDLGAKLAPNPPEGSRYPGELLLARNIEPVLEALGFQHYMWDCTVPVTHTNLQRYMVWIKQQLVAHKVVMFAALMPSSFTTDNSIGYDHIMPSYGIVYNSSTVDAYDVHDVLIWSDMFRNTVERALSTTGFFAAHSHCKSATGCIPKDVPNFATAMGGLIDAHKLFLPLQLIILGWSDGQTKPWVEPDTGCKRSVSADYQLKMPTAAKFTGQQFTVFRCDGEGSLPADPTSITDVAHAPGCKGFVFTAGLMWPSS